MDRCPLDVFPQPHTVFFGSLISFPLCSFLLRARREPLLHGCTQIRLACITQEIATHFCAKAHLDDRRRSRCAAAVTGNMETGDRMWWDHVRVTHMCFRKMPSRALARCSAGTEGYPPNQRRHSTHAEHSGCPAPHVQTSRTYSARQGSVLEDIPCLA